MATSIVIRQCEENDLADLLDIAQHIGFGLTHLLPNATALAEKIELAQRSFAKKIDALNNELYLFVMEDTASKKVIGCSGIITQVGDVQPYYNYKIIHHIQSSDELGIAHKNSVLQLSNDYQGLSELGMLALQEQYHGLHLGTFLSRVRFLYLVDNPQRVTAKIIAQMRGIIDNTGECVFWQGVGQKFIDLPFLEVDQRIAQGHGHFVAELLPDTPIAVALLPDLVQAVIGKTHPETVPDLVLLTKEGFTFENYINIFEGGPCLELYLKESATVRNAHRVRIAAIVPQLSGPAYMIATLEKKFRACLGEVVFQDEESITLTTHTAQLLNVNIGDTVRISL